MKYGAVGFGLWRIKVNGKRKIIESEWTDPLAVLRPHVIWIVSHCSGELQLAQSLRNGWKSLLTSYWNRNRLPWYIVIKEKSLWAWSTSETEKDTVHEAYRVQKRNVFSQCASNVRCNKKEDQPDGREKDKHCPYHTGVKDVGSGKGPSASRKYHFRLYPEIFYGKWCKSVLSLTR